MNQIPNLNQLLEECENEIQRLLKYRVALNAEIKVQRLRNWMKQNGIDTADVVMNQEMYQFILREGFPGGYIEYEKDKWKPGTKMTIKYQYESGNIAVAPIGNHPGIFPADMVLRAIKESAL